jgi:hypothetical protein
MSGFNCLDFNDRFRFWDAACASTPEPKLKAASSFNQVFSHTGIIPLIPSVRLARNTGVAETDSQFTQGDCGRPKSCANGRKYSA